jgi:hypothetical protein
VQVGVEKGSGIGLGVGRQSRTECAHEQRSRQAR